MQSLVRRASQYNYAVDVTYDEIDLKCEPTNAVFLSMNEITRIYYYKFEKQDRRRAKERIRDMFVLGCLTSARYSKVPHFAVTISFFSIILFSFLYGWFLFSLQFPLSDNADCILIRFFRLLPIVQKRLPGNSEFLT